MSGAYKGLQAHIKEHNPLVEWVPCAAHTLHLVGANCVNCCLETEEFFNFVQTLFKFSSKSCARCLIITAGLQPNINNRIEALKTLCHTRWSAHAPATKALTVNYANIHESLNNIAGDLNQNLPTRLDWEAWGPPGLLPQGPPLAAAAAPECCSGLVRMRVVLRLCTCVDTLFYRDPDQSGVAPPHYVADLGRRGPLGFFPVSCRPSPTLIMWNNILSRFHKTNTALQAVDLDLSDATDLVRLLKAHVAGLREEFDNFEKEAKEISSSVSQQYKVDKQQQRKRKKHSDEAAETEFIQTGRERVRTGVFLAVIDRLVAKMDRRYQSYSDLHHTFGFFNNISSVSSDDLYLLATNLATNLQKQYTDDLEDDFANEICQLREFLQGHETTAARGRLQLISNTDDLWREVQTLLFSIDEINKNPDLLPNITLGYHVYDSCGDPRLAIGSVLQILSGPGNVVPNYSCGDEREIVGFIGGRSTGTSLPIAHLLSIYGYTQISYSLIDPVLKDHVWYPYHFSTGPDDYIQHVAIAELVEHLGWTWVIILATGDERGERESQNLRNEITKHGACVDFIGTLTDDINTNTRTLQLIQKSTAEVVILCAEQFPTPTLFFIQKIIKQKTLVVPATWIAGFVFPLFKGSLIFAEKIYFFDNSEFEDYVLSIKEDLLLKDLLTVGSSCLTHDKEKDMIFKNLYRKHFKNCSSLKLRQRHDGRSYRVYTAVYGLAHAEHDMLCSSGQYCNKQVHKNIHRNQLHRYLRNVHFKDPKGGNVNFNDVGFLNMYYSIKSWYPLNDNKSKITSVGTYRWVESEGNLEIDIQCIVWKKNTNNQEIAIGGEIERHTMDRRPAAFS
ncbi:hypothetical protein XELAEV_18008723mg [Xenopus laevis]|uniref:Receptor ligand binding region domain-containing protein n=1 Tax=Xenopus laevis TaxID=8355 RepID=A0A974DR13_XENLA|nr:hypothetical protein XELAEV_18008723mg [Xenopus laevis]